MKTNLIITLLVIIMTSGCNNKKNDPSRDWSEKELNEWFSKGEWRQGWSVQPDETVDKREFAKQYFKNSERWDKAFAFLKEQNLSALDPGRYELDGENLFVNVEEYVTRNEEKTKYEAHRKYADIQYLVAGEEKIGVKPLDETTITAPYDSKIDASFSETSSDNYRIARPDRFFVFFPDDAHRPGVKSGENQKVRKVVAKVRID